jgi:HAD superfamily hydrolase (TIGR01509 family)
MIKLIIFDWDDVFTKGSIAGYYAAYHAALESVGVHLPPEEEDRRIKEKWGVSDREEVEYLLQEHPELIDKAYEVYEQHAYGQPFLDHISIIPGAQKFLTDIAQKYTLALATGANPKVLRDMVMPAYAIPDVFSQIITIYDLDDISLAKPHPHIAQTIMKTQGITPEETILVGDAPTDMQMAWNAGIEPVAVLTGHLNRQQAEALGVKYIIDNVTQLEDILQKYPSV